MSVLTSSPRRVTVVAPHTRADVALPLEATVAEVVQQLVGLVLVDVDDPPAASGGWLLGRLGREPLDGEQLVGASGLRDGEVLYLTPRSARLPPVVFDDVVDVLAEGARTNRWTPASTARAASGAALVCVVAAVAALLASGPPWQAAAATAGGLAALLLLSAVGTARALGESALATAVVVAASAFAGVAGLVSLGGNRDLLELGPAGVVLGCAGVLCTCLLGALVVGRPAPVLVGTGLVALAGLAGAGWAGSAGEPAPRVAAVAVVVLLLGQPLLPVAALRLARLPFPRLPADPAEFRRNRSAALDDGVLERAARADDALTALVAAVHLALLAALTVLLLSPDRWGRVLGIAGAVVVLVRARHAQVRPQRAAQLLTGAGALLVAAVHAVWGAPGTTHAAAAAAAVGLAAACVAYARKAPGRSPSAYAWRLLDVVEFAGTASLIPLALAVFDLYSTVRGLAG